jgi:hypothetical protein
VGQLRKHPEFIIVVAQQLIVMSSRLSSPPFSWLAYSAQPFRISRYVLPISVNYFIARGTSH